MTIPPTKHITSQKGFTIVEVLVVCVVIAALAIITTMTYSNFQRQARDEDRATQAQSIANRLEHYYRDNGEYPSAAALVGQSASTVKEKLQLPDPSVLIFPLAPSGTTNSLTKSAASTTQLAYNGTTINPDEQLQCDNDINGGCDTFDLEWIGEDGMSHHIASNH